MSLKNALLTGSLGLGLIAGTAGCDGFLDVNDDPNRATEVAGSLLFPTAVATVGSTRAIEVNPAGALLSQQWTTEGAFGVFADPEIFIISPFTTGNYWTSNYVSILGNLSILIDQSESTEDGATPSPNEAAQAKIFSAYAYYSLTVLFEDIPFSQSLQATEFPQPEFDSQEEVLRGVNSLVDEAIAQFDFNNPRRIDTGDVFFGGDLQKWVNFGNSIKLKSLMLLRGGGADVDSEIDALIANPNLIRTNDGNALIPFNSSTPNPAQRLLVNFPFRYNFFSGGLPLINVMNALNDPRRQTFFDLVIAGTDVAAANANPAVCSNVTNRIYEGVAPGQGFGLNPRRCQVPYVSLNFQQPSSSERLVTADEVLLLEAEYLASKGQLSQADAKYRQGIQANFAYTASQGIVGAQGPLSDGAQTAYLNSLPSLSSLSSSEAVADVVEQHYIATFARGIDGWTLIRRTGDVGLIDRRFPVGGVESDFLTRFPYPQAVELTNNPNAPTQPALTAPMFFMRNSAGN